MGAQHPVRFLEAFVEGLDLKACGFGRIPKKPHGRWPHENPAAPRAPLRCTGVFTQSPSLLITKFRETQPEFYAGYQSARVIVDRGGSGGTPPAPPPHPPVVPK